MTVVDAARDADADSRTRLGHLRQEIFAGVAALQPSIDTPAGRQQLTAFLEAKAVEAQRIETESQNAAHRFASALNTLGGDYESLADSRGGVLTPVIQTVPQTPDDESPQDENPTVHMASWGQMPLSPADTPPPIPSPPSPTPGPELPTPLQDFTDYQLQGQQTPTWTPPPPPHTGEPINLGPAGPRPPMVITLAPSEESTDLFPNCDNRELLKVTGQLVGGGVGAAVAVSGGPFTGGLTWAGLGVAAITLTDAIDALAVCKGVAGP